MISKAAVAVKEGAEAAMGDDMKEDGAAAGEIWDRQQELKHARS